MKRVTFNLSDYPKFWAYTRYGENGHTWIDVFEKCKYKTATIELDGKLSMSEDEYTWFVMRWS